MRKVIVITTAVVLFVGLPSLVTGCGPAETRPSGGLNACVKSKEAFYSMRGEYDMDRAPLRYPYSLVKLYKEPVVLSRFDDGHSVLLDEVGDLAYTNKFFLGNGRVMIKGPGWFAILPDNEFRFFPDHEGFQKFLNEKGLKYVPCTSALTVIESFRKGISCQPLFDVQEMRRNDL